MPINKNLRWLILLVFIFNLSFAQTPLGLSQQTRIQNNLYTQAIQLFERSLERETLSAAPQKTLWHEIMSWITPVPSERNIENAQVDALDSLLNLKDVRCLSTLLRVSSFHGGYSSNIQHRARFVLKELLPIFGKSDRSSIIASFTNDLDEMKDFYDPLGVMGTSEIQKINFLINSSTKISESIEKNGPPKVERLNYCAQNYIEAGKAIINFPMQSVCSSMEILEKNPLGIIGGVTQAIYSTVINLPSTVLGIATNGAYGSSGKTLGNQIASIYVIVYSVAAPKSPAVETSLTKVEPIFRGDARPLEVIFKDGIQPNPGNLNNGVPVVFATTDLSAAAVYAFLRSNPGQFTYVYRVDPSQLNHVAKPRNDLIQVSSIPTESIMGAYILKNNNVQISPEFNLNTDYQNPIPFVKNSKYKSSN